MNMKDLVANDKQVASGTILPHVTSRSRPVSEMFEDSDWATIFFRPGEFIFAGDPTTRKLARITSQDIVAVIAADDGFNDGDPWVGLFLTKDGRYLCIEASCDNTGWDCSCDISIEIHADIGQAKAMMSNASRARLFGV